MDPLSILRDYTVWGELDRIVRAGDEFRFGSKYAFPCSAETAYSSKQGSLYTLETLLFFVRHHHLKHTDYLQSARSRRLPAVTISDHKPLLDYLLGRTSSADAIEFLPPPAAPKPKMHINGSKIGEGVPISSEPFLADATRQVLTGLAYLHRQHIVHRDIKPSNLLINTAHQVKIADFGVSRILAQTMDPCNSSIGTIAYMSPERINTDLNHDIYIGYAGDIWSFGLSILEFYLGRFPFGEKLSRQGDWASLMCAICYSNPPEAPPTASPEFQSFISCYLQLKMNKNEEEFKDYLKDFASAVWNLLTASSTSTSSDHRQHQHPPFPL